MASRTPPRSRWRRRRSAPDTASVVAELSDRDLRRLLKEGRTLARGSEPSFESLKRYGVRNPSSLELWLRQLEEEISRRKESRHSAAEIAPPVGR